jgi:hypothetical protein
MSLPPFAAVSDAGAAPDHATSEKIMHFRMGIRNVAASTDNLLKALRAHKTHTLGLRLATLLKDLRQQRSYCLDITSGPASSMQRQAFLDALSALRARAGLWLTLHASSPELLHDEAHEFEMQSYSALGHGILWADSLRPAGGTHGNTHSHESDEQMLSSFFNSQPSSAEDITDQAFTGWKEALTQPGWIN